MNKHLKYIGFITMIIIAVTTGVFLGMKVEKYSVEEANGKLSDSTKIAIINLDEGANYQDEQRNFTNEILGNEVDQYTFTGLEDAKSGTIDGRYSSYVIIPSDFSKNVVSINNSPSKSLLKYEISGNLTDNASDKAWQNVMKLKEKINDTVGYMYISSILSDFHEGQSNALKVLSNDNKDKEVIMAISNLDLVATLDLREIDKLQNNIEDLDINPNIEENKKIIEAIDVAYKNYLSETSDQLGMLKGQSTNINTDINNIEVAGHNIKNIENDDGTPNYLTNNTTTFLSTYNSSISENLLKLGNNIDYEMEKQVNGGKDFKKEKSDNLDILVNKLQGTHEEYETENFETIKEKAKEIRTTVLDTKNSAPVWNDFSKLESVLINQKNQEQVDNAVQYLDKSILEGFSEFDYTTLNLTYDTIIATLELNLETDKKIKASLIIYAKSLGKNDIDSKNYTIKDYLENNNEILTKFPEIESSAKTELLINNAEEKLKIDTKTLLESATGTINDTIANYIDAIVATDIKKGDVETKIEDYKDDLGKLPTTDLNDLKNTVDQLRPVVTTDLIKQVKNDLNPLILEQKQNKQKLLEVVQNHKVNSGLLHNQFLLYDPIQALNMKEIAGYVKEYEANNTSTKYKIEKKNREYTTFVSESYNNTNKQVDSMKEDINKYQTLSDEKITTGLENAKSIKVETSSLNNELMSNYINKLPYTKNGTVANTTVYDFITAPTDMDGFKTESISQNSSLILFKGISIVAIGITLLWGLTYIVVKKKKKKD